MKISYNEILTLSQKIFEGAGCSPGQYQDAAEMISWLALQGIKDWVAICNHLDENFLKNELAKELAHLLYEDDTTITLDGQQKSCLFCGTPATDFAYLRAIEKDDSAVHLRMCQHPMLLLASLSGYAQRGMHSLTQWRESDQVNTALFVAKQPLPTFYQGMVKKNALSSHNSIAPYTDVTILYSSHNAFLIPPDSEIIYSPKQLQQQRADHLEQGIEIDVGLWQRLNGLAKAVLVEATEESRQRGAGEDAAI